MVGAMSRTQLFIVVVVIAAAVGATSGILMHDKGVGRAAWYDAVTGLGETEGQLVTLLDYLESGRRLAREYLAKQPATEATTLWDVAQRCGPACARVEIDIKRQGDSVMVSHGSGVVVADGKFVLTAAHPLVAEEILAIRVILRDGRVVAATVAKSDFTTFNTTGRDWAVLKLADDRPADLVSLKLGKAEQGEPVIALGYPDQIGIDEHGRIAYSRDDPLAPLLFPAHVNGTDPITLTPAAGAVPLGGMSGGPVVNAGGEVVGIFVSVSRTPGAGKMLISYGATPIAAFGDALRRAVESSESVR